MKRTTLSAFCLAMLASVGAGAGADDHPRCCFSMAAYVLETDREMFCNNPLGQVWHCPKARAHMPEQRWCDVSAEYAQTSKKCYGTRPPARIPWVWVQCGPSIGQCLDGPPSGGHVNASNDLCGGRCNDRLGETGACSNADENAAATEAARIAKRQSEELEAQLATAKTAEPGEPE